MSRHIPDIVLILSFIVGITILYYQPTDNDIRCYFKQENCINITSEPHFEHQYLVDSIKHLEQLKQTLEQLRRLYYNNLKSFNSTTDKIAYTCNNPFLSKDETITNIISILNDDANNNKDDK